jgi:hypothetical protein
MPIRIAIALVLTALIAFIGLPVWLFCNLLLLEEIWMPIDDLKAIWEWTIERTQ